MHRTYTSGLLNRAPYAVALVAALAVPGQSEAQFPRIRDSSGIRIVETAARSSARIAFTLAPTPSIDIGGLKGNPDDELDTYLRNYHFPVTTLSDGGQVVGDRIRLRFFDANGRQIKVVGRAGQGPQEFQNTGAICRTRGDTIVVNDRFNGRVSVLDKAGVFVREFSVTPLQLPRRGCFDDGTFLLEAWAAGPVGSGSGSRLRLERWRLDGTRIKELGLFGGSFSNSFLTAQASVSATGNRFYAADSRTSEVKIYSTDGVLISIIRTDDPIVAVTASEAAAMQSAAVGAGSSATRAPDQRPKPTHWPAYHAIQTDDAGRLWVQDYAKASSDPKTWTVFDSAGQMLGKFRMDAQKTYSDPFVLRFVRDAVMVHTEDKDGAPHITTYRLLPVR